MNEPNDPADEILLDKNESDVKTDPTSPKMKRFSIPIWVWVFLLLIVILDIIGLQHFPDAFAEYRVYMTAENRIANGETSAAIADLYKLSSEHTNSQSVVIKTIDLSMENGYYDVAAYVMDNYLNGMDVDEPDYSRMTSYGTKLQKYYTTYDAIDQIVKKYSDSEESVNIDNYAIIKALEAMLNDPEQDYAVVHYYLGAFSWEDIENAKNEMQQSYDINPECFDVRVQLGVMYRQLGEYEKTKKLNQEALLKDNSDSGALRSAAIIQMIEGDLEDGVATAKKAYLANPDDLYVRETYLIALTKSSQKEEALKIQNEMTAAGETLEADAVKLLNGDITLKDYYVRG